MVRGRFEDGAIVLEANLDLQPEGQAGTRLSLTLTNAGKEPLTGTLRFPTVAGLKIGKPEDTWYFDSRRGGAIHHLLRQFRDEIGEAHPLQVDGFFNPQAAVGVCFMPRDLEGVFRWYCLGKDDAGGSYALEYLPQTLSPGQVVAIGAGRGPGRAGRLATTTQRLSRVGQELAQAGGSSQGLVPASVGGSHLRPQPIAQPAPRRATGPGEPGPASQFENSRLHRLHAPIRLGGQQGVWALGRLPSLPSVWR